MGFWEDQVLELNRGIDALLGEDATLMYSGHTEPPAGQWTAPPAVDSPTPSPDVFAPVDWSGPAAQAAGEATASAARGHAVRAGADQEVAAALTKARAAAEHARGRLRTIRADIDDGVRARQPSMDAAGGQMQMAQFLHDKAGEILAVIRQAQQDSTLHAARLAATTVTYNA
ncbi:MAG: DUF4226 domain-containing protein [Mycobacterium sp.]